MAEETKLAFARLYLDHRFSIQELAARAGVPIYEIDKMLLDQLVAREKAQKILETLSTMTGQHYSLSNVQIRLLSPEI